MVLTVRRRWQYYDLVGAAPGTSPYVSGRGGSNDEIHVVVIDEDGGITGTIGEVIRSLLIQYQKLPTQNLRQGGY